MFENRMLTRLSMAKKPVIIAAIALCLYAVTGFLVVPAIIKSKAPAIIEQQLGRQATVNQIRLNPFALSLTVRGFAIKEPDGESFAGFEELYLNFQVSSLFRLAFTFGDVSLINPYGHVKILADGNLNFSDLLAKVTQKESPQDPGGEVPPVLIQRLHIEKGRFIFSDLSLPTPYEETIFPIQLTLNDFSTRKNTDSPYSFTASMGDSATINWEGDVSVNPLRSQGRLVVSKVDTVGLWKYIQDYVNFKVTSGEVDLSGNYLLALGETGPTAALTEGEFELSELVLVAKEGETTILSVPSLSARNATVNIGNKQVEISAVTSKGAKANGWLAPDGKFFYQTVFALDDLKEKFHTALASEDEPAAGTQPWIVTIDTVNLENYAVHFEDRTLEKAKQIDLDPIKVEVKNISNHKDSQAEINAALKVNQTGIVELKGLATINPVSAELTLKVAHNPVKPMQPYVDAVAPVELASGTTNLEGRVWYKALGGDGPNIRFEGQAGIENLRTVDRRKSEDLYSLKTLAIKGLTLDLNPNKLGVSEVFLSQPDFRLAIWPDGKINVVTILTLKDDSAKENESGKETESLLERLVKYIAYHIEGPMPITVDTIRVEKGAVDFSDLFIKPSFAADVRNLRGRVKGLSSKPGTRADVLLEGEVNKYSPVKISGQINPLSKEKYADLAMSFKNFDLTSTSPYSGKFAGYTIERGKLSLDLKYRVAENVFTGENKITVEQLSLGERVESPDATKLPVSLGVALLKDANGNIKLDVPVEGDINDPHFDFGKVIASALTNTITKAVSSPFAALGSLVGGSGEELSYIEYEFGSATLRPEQIEKLDKLAKALQERPGLRLEITGTADKENDRSVLTQIEKQPVDHEELLLLAQDRSRRIKIHLVENGGVPAERISLTREQIIESSEGDHARTNIALAGS
jgi:outer membrane protein OmpA-like peptidoglycan-associated protein